MIWAWLPQTTVALRLSDGMFKIVAWLIEAEVPDPFDIIHPNTVETGLAGGFLKYGLLVFGLVCLWFAFASGDDDFESDDDTDAPAEVSGLPEVDKRQMKKSLSQAAKIAKKGDFHEAGELLFSVGAMEKAADYFSKADDFIRVAEIRHDQNRFDESAAFYLKAGKHESAGVIYAQQSKWQQAAECYLECDSKTVAAEMFEKAEMWRQAGDCYREVEFHRHAAQCFVKCESWLLAAECLSTAYREETANSAVNDPEKLVELKKMVVQSGRLYMRGREPEKAMEVLQSGECYVEAGEVALRLKQFGRAAEFFRDSGDLTRAAEALRELGETEAAARMLGVHHRELGEMKEAATCFEEAGDYLEAGDYHRQLEDFQKAGECYEKHGDYGQAAEMFKSCGNRAQAAECFERVEKFTEAAECWALEDKPEKEAELLEKAGNYLTAGEVYHREGIDEEAITALQKVEPADPGFGRASALLGDIFQGRGQLSLAIKKLRQAIGDAPISRENLEVFYTLATLHASDQEAAEAVDLYEKILGFDYHYRDVEERLIAAKEQVKAAEPILPEAASQATSPSRSAMPSAQPGRYQVVGELGRGGMGIVYKAKDTVLDRHVAYKVLPDTLKENPQALANFLREAKAAAKLNHPGIVTVYDTGEQDGRYYIAMEYVDGTTLKEILRRRGVISPSGILHVLVQVCEALAYAHEKGVVHRDIKSANTMWTRDKKAKIMDFGLARVVEEVRNHTTVVSGTPYYMSPEQTLGKNIDHRTDIYSLGVTIFEMVTGAVPFREGNIPYHHVHTPPPSVRDLRPELPDGLASVVDRCLQKDPARRYQSAREILIEVKTSLGQSATRTRVS